VLLSDRRRHGVAHDARRCSRGYSDPGRRDLLASGARAALAPAIREYRRARHRTEAPSRRARWFSLVLRALPIPALRGVSARHRYREATPADLRSVLRLA